MLTGPGELTEVKSMVAKPVFLDDYLRPLWNLMRYNGLVHGFFSTVEERRASHIIRFISTVFIILFVLSFGVFQVTQLVIGFPNRKNIEDISLNVVFSIGCFKVIIFLHQFYLRHNQFIELLKDWNEMEMLFFDCCDRDRSEKIGKIVYVLLFFGTIPWFFLAFYYNTKSPNESIFFSHYDMFRDIFSVNFLALVFAVSIYFFVMIFIFSEMISTVFFYQAGCLIANLKQELLSSITPVHSRNENPYRLIWEKYESIQQKVNRANQLFGIMIIVNELSTICVACFNIYVIITAKEDDEYLYLCCIPILGILVAKTIGCNRLISHLYLSSGELKSTVGILLSEKWHLLSEEQRVLLNTFIIRLDKGNLTACPLNLYTIDPTNLLSLLTLHISYVIVLLQTP